MVYLLTAILAFILIIPAGINRSINRISGIFLLILLCLLASIRVDTGTDFLTYVDIWDFSLPLKETDFSELATGFYEPLFAIINSLLKSLSSSQLLFFAFYACLTLIVMHVSLQRIPLINQPYAYLIYLSVFYLPYTLNGLRQSVAMSILLLSIPAILQRRATSVLLLTVIAAGFHFSGLLIGIGYMFSRACERLHFTAWKLFFITLLVGGSMAATGTVSQLFFFAFEGKIDVYKDLFDAPSTPSNVIMRCGICMLMLIFTDRGRGDRRQIDLLLFIYFLGLLIYLALFQFNTLATRFNMLFRMLEVVLFPMIAIRLRPGKRCFFVIITLLLALATLWVTAQHPDYHYKTDL